VRDLQRKGLAAEFDWPGTRDFSAWLAVPDALAFLRKLGPARLRARNHALAAAAAARLARAWGTECDGPPELHGSMMAVRLPDRLQGRDPVRLMHDWIERHRLVVPLNAVDGVLWARLSAHAYSGPADYGRLLRATSAYFA
jgi:isopenicillin-N epimerase